ncbi:sensor histidine kinase [Robertkochia sediminum]|uniref:sensor histidine kinase n=1 Tax=Robertkochia sediminum TaxID=2785326 RepID=UPI00193235AE|nr:histidine kinase [Robertkochia sediminum]MBL7472388.1 histidine kinase [Robertkochia sediminum]
MNIFKATPPLTRYFKYGISYWHHIIFWVIYFLFNTIRWGFYYDDFLFSLKGNLLEFPIHILICYTTIYYLIPRFIPSKRYFSFFAIVIGMVIGMMYLKFELTYHLISKNVWPEGPEYTDTLTPNYLITITMGEIYVLSFVTAIKVTIEWLKENQRAKVLQREQLETELLFLRSQISPHFFFNTLNNIYSLTMEKSDKAPEVILRLSDLMRYLLYQTKHHKQPLKQEIECIHNYLELERLRYGDQVQVKMNVEGDPDNKTIPPMLLISFVENSFKHGAAKNLQRTDIHINFQITKNELLFKVTNTLPPERSRSSGRNSEGIGLKNVKKRLELSYTPGTYELNNCIKDKEYSVTLKIPA